MILSSARCGQLAVLNRPAVWGLAMVAVGDGRCWSGLENTATGTGGRGAGVRLVAVLAVAGGVLVAAVAVAGAAVRGRRGRRCAPGAGRALRARVMKGPRSSCRRWMFWLLRSISYC